MKKYIQASKSRDVYVDFDGSSKRYTVEGDYTSQLYDAALSLAKEDLEVAYCQPADEYVVGVKFGYHTARYRVSATSPEQAKEKALEEAYLDMTVSLE